MLKKILLLSTITILLGSSAVAYLWYSQSTSPLLSPMSDILSPLTKLLEGPRPTPKKVVYGFLPYWNLKEADSIHHPLITHLAYFGIDFDETGQIAKLTEEGTTEPGWNHLKSETVSQLIRKTKSSDNKAILVMRAMTQAIIEGIVNNPSRRQIAIQSTLEIVKARNFDGINIDFEYAGTPDPLTRQNFAVFVQELSTACKLALPGCVVSIDVFADSATKFRLWDYPRINPYVDHIIVMAYDYFRPSSTQAGPVSPLRGACSLGNTQNCLDTDISTNIAELSKILPTSKIILGVPFYGYQWQTTTTSFLANSYKDTGHLATYKRIQELIREKNELFPLHRNQKVFGIQTLWDDLTMTPRIVFEDQSRTIQQIYYDDTRSLSLKYDLVNQSGLGGIAIWALGYEGDAPNLWKLIQAKFFTTATN